MSCGLFFGGLYLDIGSCKNLCTHMYTKLCSQVFGGDGKEKVDSEHVVLGVSD